MIPFRVRENPLTSPPPVPIPGCVNKGNAGSESGDGRKRVAGRSGETEPREIGSIYASPRGVSRFAGGRSLCRDDVTRVRFCPRDQLFSTSASSRGITVACCPSFRPDKVSVLFFFIFFFVFFFFYFLFFFYVCGNFDACKVSDKVARQGEGWARYLATFIGALTLDNGGKVFISLRKILCKIICRPSRIARMSALKLWEIFFKREMYWNVGGCIEIWKIQFLIEF